METIYTESDSLLLLLDKLCKKAEELKQEKNEEKIKVGLGEILENLQIAVSIDHKHSPLLLHIFDYAKAISQKSPPNSFDFLLLLSRLKRASARIRTSLKSPDNKIERIDDLEQMSADTVHLFESKKDISGLVSLAQNGSGPVAVMAVRAISRIGNAQLLKNLAISAVYEASLEAIAKLESIKATNEIVEVALSANQSIATVAVEALFRLKSVEGLLAVAMKGKEPVSLLAVKMLERLGAVSALKAISLLTSPAGSAAFACLIRLKMAGIPVPL